MRALLLASIAVFSVFTSGLEAKPSIWNNEVRVGFGGTYKGDISKNDPLLGSELKSTQSTYTLLLAYRYIQMKKLYAAVDFDFKGFQDSRTYDGSQVVTNSQDMFYQAGLEIGYPWMMGENWVGAPYVGFSSVSSKLNIQQSSAIPSDQAYIVRRWFQGMLGYYGRGEIASSWELGFKIALLYQLSDPTVSSNLSLEFMSGAEEVKLKKRCNFYIELPVAYALEGGQSFLELTPFYETQNMGQPNKDFGGSSVDKKVFSDFVYGARLSYLYRF